jgi:hypothetical protein
VVARRPLRLDEALQRRVPAFACWGNRGHTQEPPVNRTSPGRHACSLSFPGRRANCQADAMRDRTTGRAGTPLVRFCPLQRSGASVALSGVAIRRTIPLRRFATSRTRCPAAAAALKRCRGDAAQWRALTRASSMRFFAGASPSLSVVPRRFAASTAVVKPRRKSCLARVQTCRTRAGRWVMRRQDFSRGDVPLPSRPSGAVL